MSKPFAEQNNYSPVHNDVLDILMPQLSPASWKVLCFILRKTVGWRKTSDAISYSQIMTGTGIGGRATVAKAIEELLGHGVIEAGKEKRKTTTYTLNPDYEIDASSKNELVQKMNQTSSKNEPELVQNLNTQRNTYYRKEEGGDWHSQNDLTSLQKEAGELLQAYGVRAWIQVVAKVVHDEDDIEYIQAKIDDAYRLGWKPALLFSSIMRGDRPVAEIEGAISRNRYTVGVPKQAEYQPRTKPQPQEDVDGWTG